MIEAGRILTGILGSVALAAALGSGTAALAKGGPDRAGGAAFFDRFDSDGNGEVTRAEVDALIAARFEEADGDGDGELSEAEMAVFAAARAQERRTRGIGRMIERLDDDGSGTLDQGELSGGREGRIFDRLDADADGVISRDEARSARGQWRARRGD